MKDSPNLMSMFPVWNCPLLHQSRVRRVLSGGAGGRTLSTGNVIIKYSLLIQLSRPSVGNIILDINPEWKCLFVLARVEH